MSFVSSSLCRHVSGFYRAHGRRSACLLALPPLPDGDVGARVDVCRVVLWVVVLEHHVLVLRVERPHHSDPSLLVPVGHQHGVGRRGGGVGQGHTHVVARTVGVGCGGCGDVAVCQFVGQLHHHRPHLLVPLWIDPIHHHRIGAVVRGVYTGRDRILRHAAGQGQARHQSAQRPARVLSRPFRGGGARLVFGAPGRGAILRAEWSGERDGHATSQSKQPVVSHESDRTTDVRLYRSFSPPLCSSLRPPPQP